VFSLFYIFSETRIIANDSHSIFWDSNCCQRFPLKSAEIWRYRNHRFGVLKISLSHFHSTCGLRISCQPWMYKTITLFIIACTNEWFTYKLVKLHVNESWHIYMIHVNYERVTSYMHESLHEDYSWLELDSGLTDSFVLIRSLPVGDFEKQYIGFFVKRDHTNMSDAKKSSCGDAQILFPLF